MKTELYVQGVDKPIIFDQTREESMLQHAKRKGLPIYDVVSSCGVLLDRTADLSSARRQKDKAHQANIYVNKNGVRSLFEVGHSKFPPERLEGVFHE